MERVADEARTASTLSAVVRRRADGILATEKLLARVLANVGIVRATDTDGIGGAHLVAEALVWNNLTPGGEIVRSTGEAFLASAHYKVVVGVANGIRATEVC